MFSKEAIKDKIKSVTASRLFWFEMGVITEGVLVHVGIDWYLRKLGL